MQQQECPPALPGKRSSWVRRTWERLTAGGWLLLAGTVVLPALTLVTEWTTHICGEVFFDPIPTPWHIAAVAWIPLANLFAWVIARRQEHSGHLRVAAFMAGSALALSGAFALVMLPISLLGLLVLVSTFWYFGVGIIGLLPLAPATAFIGGFFIRRRLCIGAKSRLPCFRMGVLAGALVALALAISGALSYVGLNLAVSDDPGRQAQGIRMLRRFGREDILHRAGQWRSGAFLFGISGMFMPDAERLSPQAGQALYYRVTGRVHENRPAFIGRGRRAASVVWDDSQGGDRVGGILKGLALRDSFFEDRIDETAATAAAEWTLVFHNDWHAEREARARLALPPGAVVTRLTLWINGEPCEAAFGGRGVVRAAYERIVRRNRDPVLVESCGPDRVQIQCFPVPAKGDMKMRLGMSIPLEVAADGVSAFRRAPAVIERNFSLPHYSVALPMARTVTLSQPPAAACWATGVVEQAATVIQQRARLEPGASPSRVALVVDGSRCMAGRVVDIAVALAALPAGIEAGVWLADDALLSVAPLVVRTPLDDASRQSLSRLLSPAACVGGRCNVGTLLGALDWLAAAPGASALVWVHGPQPAPLGSVESLRMRLERSATGLTVYAVQVDEGPCAVTQALNGIMAVQTLPPVEVMHDTGGTLHGLFGAWRAGEQAWVFEREVVLPEVASEGPAASLDLAALWAADEVLRLLRGGNPGRQEAARELALAWRVITPVSSAVVLESQRQYQEAGLEPVAAETVPTVPEPEFVWLALVSALVVFGAWLHRRRRAVAREA